MTAEGAAVTALPPPLGKSHAGTPGPLYVCRLATRGSCVSLGPPIRPGPEARHLLLCLPHAQRATYQPPGGCQYECMPLSWCCCWKNGRALDATIAKHPPTALPPLP